MQLHRISAILAFCTASINVYAAVPTHCKPDEFSVVDAWMGDTYQTKFGFRNTKRGKLLSLCADKETEPFSKLSYRYGEPGHPEFEVVATEGAKFNIDSRSTSPHTGDDIVFFKKGPYTYYVAIAGGQGHGVSLYVYKGNSSIAGHFSGNEEGEDYQMGPAAIDFSEGKSSSPVIAWKKAPHSF